MSTAARLALITRPGCHLCEDAKAAIERVVAVTGDSWVELDVTDDVELEREYGDRLPVVLLDGREHGYWRVEEDRLLRDLTTSAGPADSAGVAYRARMAPARTHLVWDWNGTLLNDLDPRRRLPQTPCSPALGGPAVTVDQHRVLFRRPIADYYAEVLGRVVDSDEFERLDKIFHDAYRLRAHLPASWRPTRPARSGLAGQPVAALHVVPRRTRTDHRDVRAGRRSSPGSTACAAPSAGTARPNTWPGTSPRWRSTARPPC